MTLKHSNVFVFCSCSLCAGEQGTGGSNGIWLQSGLTIGRMCQGFYFMGEMNAFLEFAKARVFIIESSRQSEPRDRENPGPLLKTGPILFGI